MCACGLGIIIILSIFYIYIFFYFFQLVNIVIFQLLKCNEWILCEKQLFLQFSLIFLERYRCFVADSI